MKVTNEQICAFREAFYFNKADEAADPIEIGLQAVFSIMPSAEQRIERILSIELANEGFRIGTEDGIVRATIGDGTGLVSINVTRLAIDLGRALA